MSLFKNKIIKINKVNDSWWIQPTVFTLSKRSWAGRPYKNFKKLLHIENLTGDNFILSLNNDQDLIIFRLCQTIHDIKIYFNLIQLNQIKETGYLDFKIKGTSITQRWDLKSIKLLKMGYIPYFSKKHLIKTFDKNTTIIWRKGGFKASK